MKRFSGILFLILLSFPAFGQFGRPEIVGQKPVSTDEDHLITIKLTDLIVIDPDDIYPWGFTLTVYDGRNYTSSNNNVTPAKDYYGQLTVPVSVNDGKYESKKYDLKITVNPVNDKPRITGQSELQIKEGTSIKLELTHLTVEDPDNTYPDDFTLAANAGSNYNVTGTTITTQPGYTGSLHVPVWVSDGELNSDLFDLIIHVIPDQPGGATGDLDIPTCFTPNNDAANDTWKILPHISSDEINNAIIRVFNKRGHLIFESKGFDHEWDGRNQGESVPAGIYFYVIDVTSQHEEKIFRGVVNVLR